MAAAASENKRPKKTEVEKFYKEVNEILIKRIFGTVDIRKWFMDEQDGKVCYTNAAAVILLPSEQGALRPCKAFISLEEKEGLMEKFNSNLETATDCLNTRTYQKTGKDNKISVLHVKNNKGESIFIDEKNLRYFKELGEVEYKGSTGKSPVFIFKDDVCYGMVMPYLHTDKEVE